MAEHKLISFAVRFNLRVTIASLPKTLRVRLGKQGCAPRRGEQHVSLSLNQAELIDELILKYGSTSDKRHHYTMIACTPHYIEGVYAQLAAWVNVQYILVGAPSPTAQFLRQFEEALASARQREIDGANAPYYLDEVEAVKEHSARLANEQAKARHDRAVAAVAKLRQIPDDKLVELIAARLGDVQAVEQIVAQVPSSEREPSAASWRAP